MIPLKCCTLYARKFGKFSNGHRTGKVSFHVYPKEKQCQRTFKLPHNCTHFTCQQSNAPNYHTIALISHAGKVMLKILQAGLQQYVNQKLPNIQVVFRKGRGTKDPIANICWIIKKAECLRIDVFELWCWKRFLRVPWTAKRSNQSILKEINPEYSLERLMLKLKLQYFGHLMLRTNSLEMTLMLGKIKDRR